MSNVELGFRVLGWATDDGLTVRWGGEAVVVPPRPWPASGQKTVLERRGGNAASSLELDQRQGGGVVHSP
jgi:hypothetical protein